MANIEQSERGFKDFLAALRRRMSLFMTVSIGLGVLVLLIAILLPSIYRSSAIVLIEQQEIPTELVRSTVTSYADQRIQTISQRVMTTSNLTEIMDKYNLYPEERAEAPTSAVLAEMRDDIELEMISADVMDPKSGRPTEATIAFELSYESKSPALAQRVTNELTNLYLSENIKNRTQMATETTSFLQDEAEELASQVSTMEAELAAFKEKHADSLPEMNDLNLQIRERLTRELRDIDGRLRSLDERIIYLESELAQLDDEERDEYLDELGLKEPGLNRLIRAIGGRSRLLRCSHEPARRGLELVVLVVQAQSQGQKDHGVGVLVHLLRGVVIFFLALHRVGEPIEEVVHLGRQVRGRGIGRHRRVRRKLHRSLGLSRLHGVEDHKQGVPVGEMIGTLRLDAFGAFLRQIKEIEIECRMPSRPVGFMVADNRHQRLLREYR